MVNALEVVAGAAAAATLLDSSSIRSQTHLASSSLLASAAILPSSTILVRSAFARVTSSSLACSISIFTSKSFTRIVVAVASSFFAGGEGGGVGIDHLLSSVIPLASRNSLLIHSTDRGDGAAPPPPPPPTPAGGPAARGGGPRPPRGGGAPPTPRVVMTHHHRATEVVVLSGGTGERGTHADT